MIYNIFVDEDYNNTMIITSSSDIDSACCYFGYGNDDEQDEDSYSYYYPYFTSSNDDDSTIRSIIADMAEVITTEDILRYFLYLSIIMFLYTAVLLQTTLLELGMMRCRRKMERWNQLLSRTTKRTIPWIYSFLFGIQVASLLWWMVVDYSSSCSSFFSLPLIIG